MLCSVLYWMDVMQWVSLVDVIGGCHGCLDASMDGIGQIGTWTHGVGRMGAWMHEHMALDRWTHGCMSSWHWKDGRMDA